MVSAYTGLSSAYLAVNWPQIAEAQQHAHRTSTSGQPASLQFFDPATAAEIEAIASQIIPSDQTPGAREAGIVYFIDRALVTFDLDKQDRYRNGLEQAQSKRAAMFPGSSNIAGLTPGQQIELLKAIEKTEFFELVRVHTIIGFFANPEYGGNRDKIGWKHIGFEDAFQFTAPFGYYDRESSDKQ